MITALVVVGLWSFIGMAAIFIAGACGVLSRRAWVLLTIFAGPIAWIMVGRHAWTAFQSQALQGATAEQLEAAIADVDAAMKGEPAAPSARISKERAEEIVAMRYARQAYTLLERIVVEADAGHGLTDQSFGDASSLLLSVRREARALHERMNPEAQ